MTESARQLEEIGNELTRELTIVNRLGLHARASTQLVQLAQKFASEVFLEKDGRSVDAKRSVLSLLELECPMGSRVLVRTRGLDADQALAAVARLFADKFGEE